MAIYVDPMRLALIAIPMLFTQLALAQAKPASAHPCDSEPVHHKLDFWIGTWDVVDTTDHSHAGTSTLQKILGGCAIDVDWKDDDGGEIREVFYFARVAKTWKQLWISSAGASKERRLVADLENGAVQFLGEIQHPDGTSHLDRSTVTPLANGRIHQVIEISRDAGKTWTVSFDGEYRRVK